MKDVIHHMLLTSSARNMPRSNIDFGLDNQWDSDEERQEHIEQTSKY